jgi:hypothetical protein
MNTTDGQCFGGGGGGGGGGFLGFAKWGARFWGVAKVAMIHIKI